jgi:phosphatidylethanolamine-binding protein (PEBP) family uncharacterized protein
MRRVITSLRGTASLSGAVLVVAIALAGCGSNGSSAAKSAAITLTSSGIEGPTLPARYTCDGANIAPALRWGPVPAGTKELVLFAVGKGATPQAPSTIEWALAGLKPELGEVAAGKVPKEAYLEEASNGKRHYSICPPHGQTREYAFAVYAVPEKVRVTPNVSGVILYHNLAEGKPEFRATGGGEIRVSYTRK